MEFSWVSQLLSLFIMDFSKVTLPLTHLTRTNVKFDRSSKYEESFLELQRWLTSTLMLTLPFSGEGFVIYSNAFHQGLGYVFMKDGKVIAYASMQLKKHE